VKRWLQANEDDVFRRRGVEETVPDEATLLVFEEAMLRTLSSGDTVRAVVNRPNGPIARWLGNARKICCNPKASAPVQGPCGRAEVAHQQCHRVVVACDELPFSVALMHDAGGTLSERVDALRFHHLKSAAIDTDVPQPRQRRCESPALARLAAKHPFAVVAARYVAHCIEVRDSCRIPSVHGDKITGIAFGRQGALRFTSGLDEVAG
jgi:hypothetical protein